MTTKDHYFVGAVAMSGAYYRLGPKPLVEGADVYLACRIDGASPCAETVVYKRLEGPEKAYEAKAERKALKALGDHPNIVSLVDEIVLKDHTAFILPFYEHQDLFEHWHTLDRDNRFPAATFRKIAEALAYAHQKGFAHRDIKLENIFLRVDENGAEPFLGDWGVSVQSIGLRVEKEYVGSEDYISPEIRTMRDGESYDPFASDIWALGVLYLYMHVFYGDHFSGINKTPTLRKALEGDRKGLWAYCKGHPEHCRDVSEAEKALVEAMLAADPEERLTAAEVVATVRTWGTTRKRKAGAALGLGAGGARVTVVLKTGRACGRPEKKFCAIVGNKTVPFGQTGAKDYTKHKTPTRMLDYVRRHGGKYHGNFDGLRKQSPATIHKKMLQVKASAKEDWANLRSPGFWSRWLLWSYPSLEMAKRHIARHFNVAFRGQGRLRRSLEGGRKKKSP